MQVADEFDYLCAKKVIHSVAPTILQEVNSVLNNPANRLFLTSVPGKQRYLSTQIQSWFARSGWELERPCAAIPEMRYDLYKDGIPLEIEIGHRRLVYADFFKFLADYSSKDIKAAIMVVTYNPLAFGHRWHCSLRSTREKIMAIQGNFPVPLLVIGVNP